MAIRLEIFEELESIIQDNTEKSELFLAQAYEFREPEIKSYYLHLSDRCKHNISEAKRILEYARGLPPRAWKEVINLELYEAIFKLHQQVLNN